MTAPIRETAEEPWLWCDIRGSFAVRHRYFCHQSLNAVFDTIVTSSSCDWLCNPLHSAPLRASLSSPANKVLISLISLAQKCDACTKQKIYWASGAVSAICRVYPVLVLLRQTLEFWLRNSGPWALDTGPIFTAKSTSCYNCPGGGLTGFSQAATPRGRELIGTKGENSIHVTYSSMSVRGWHVTSYSHLFIFIFLVSKFRLSHWEVVPWQGFPCWSWKESLAHLYFSCCEPVSHFLASNFSFLCFPAPACPPSLPPISPRTPQPGLWTGEQEGSRQQAAHL